MRHSDKMPTIIVPNGVKHRHTVFQVLARGEDGLPTECRMIRDQEEVEVKEGMEFMTVYVPTVMFKPVTDRKPTR